MPDTVGHAGRYVYSTSTEDDALEAADVVFRIAHQLHGAIGFCDEATLSWLSRYSVPLRRLPTGLSGTLDQLRRRIDRRGLRGIFAGAGPA